MFVASIPSPMEAMEAVPCLPPSVRSTTSAVAASAMASSCPESSFAGERVPVRPGSPRCRASGRGARPAGCGCQAAGAAAAPRRQDASDASILVPGTVSCDGPEVLAAGREAGHGGVGGELALRHGVVRVPAEEEPRTRRVAADHRECPQVAAAAAARRRCAAGPATPVRTARPRPRPQTHRRTRSRSAGSGAKGCSNSPMRNFAVSTW